MSYVNSRLKLELPRVPQVKDTDVYKELQAVYNSLQVFHSQVAAALGLAGLDANKLAELGEPFGAPVPSTVCGRLASPPGPISASRCWR